MQIFSRRLSAFSNVMQRKNDNYKISTTSSELFMDVLEDKQDSEPLGQELLRVKMREELLSRNLAKQKLMLVTWAENKRQGDIFTSKSCESLK